MTKTLFYLMLFIPLLGLGQEWQQIGSDIQLDSMPTNKMTLSEDGKFLATSYQFSEDYEGLGLVKVFEFVDGEWIQLGDDINYGDVYHHSLGFATPEHSLDLSEDGQTLVIGSPYSQDYGTDSGKVGVYRFIESNWIKIGEDISNQLEQSRFGYDVSLSADGNRIVIGSLTYPTGGMVQVYQLDGSAWIQWGQTLAGVGTFGTAVDINDEGNIITAANSDPNGFVKVYKLEGLEWIETGSFTGDRYYSVALNAEGNIVALGAALVNNPNTGGWFAGRATVYANDNGIWTQLGNSLYGVTAFGNFGTGISLNAEGNILAVGAETISSVNAYKIIDNEWLDIGDVQDPLIRLFGNSICLSNDGNILAIGARAGVPTSSPQLGRVFEFVCTAEVPEFTIPEPICPGNSTVVIASSESQIINWYDSEDGTEPVFTGLEFITPELTETTTYWIENINDVDCASERIPVMVEVLPAPILEAETTYAICSENPATLYASSPNNVIFWYANETDEEYLYHGNLFVTEVLTENTTFWVEAYNILTGCTSERIEVTITVSEALPAPIADDTQEFVPGMSLADLIVEHTAPLTWYADAQLTQELPETTLVVEGTTYYVTQSGIGCESASTAILVDTFLGNGNLNSDKFAYYPNPVKDVLNFKGKEVIKSVQVYDLNGKLILNQNSNSISNINLSILPKGTYVVKATTDKGVNTLKIVKN